MSELLLERVWCAPLKNVSLRLGAGLSVIVGAESDGATELVELCAGVREPRRGRVTLDGARPSASAACRRGIASLLPEEARDVGGDVRGWLAELGALIGFELGAALAWCGVAAERSLSTLSGAERRELALAIALAHPRPSLVVLHEPLAAGAPELRERILGRLVELARECPVLIGTASIADARRVGGATYLLDRGLLDEKAGGAWPGSLTPGLGACLAIEADAPRGLVAALAQHPDVRELSYDERRGGRVLVRGADLGGLALAVARAAVSAGVDIRLLRAQAEDLGAARAAAAGASDADAYRAARSRARSATSATPLLTGTDRSPPAPSAPAEPPERAP
jgi:ABC-type thiamine transport system ATPase subunit